MVSWARDHKTQLSDIERGPWFPQLCPGQTEVSVAADGWLWGGPGQLGGPGDRVNISTGYMMPSLTVSSQDKVKGNILNQTKLFS